MTNKGNNNIFDIFEPKSGHKGRFVAKIKQKQQKKRLIFLQKWAVAISFLLLFGLGIDFYNKQNNQAKTAPEVKQNEMYFSAIINQEIKEIKSIKTSETSSVFNDALKQMSMLEKAYQKLLKDYQKNNDKYILSAMIENFNQRIEILQFVKQQIEEIKQTKNEQNETYKA